VFGRLRVLQLGGVESLPEVFVSQVAASAMGKFKKKRLNPGWDWLKQTGVCQRKPQKLHSIILFQNDHHRSLPTSTSISRSWVGRERQRLPIVPIHWKKSESICRGIKN